MVKELFDLSGKVALVTGGSKGLGKAMARGLAEAGADVMIASRSEAELKKALQAVMHDNKDPKAVIDNLSKEAKRILAQ